MFSSFNYRIRALHLSWNSEQQGKQQTAQVKARSIQMRSSPRGQRATGRFIGGEKLPAEARQVVSKTHRRHCETWHFRDARFSQDNYINHMNNSQANELRMYAWLMMFWSNPLCRAFSCFNNQDTVEGVRTGCMEEEGAGVLVYKCQDSQWQAS